MSASRRRLSAAFTVLVSGVVACTDSSTAPSTAVSDAALATQSQKLVTPTIEVMGTKAVQSASSGPSVTIVSVDGHPRAVAVAVYSTKDFRAEWIDMESATIERNWLSAAGAGYEPVIRTPIGRERSGLPNVWYKDLDGDRLYDAIL